MVYSFQQLPKAQATLAGGKGKNLARLYQAGYRVPDGFVILPAAFSGDALSAAAWGQVEGQLARLRKAEPRAAFAVRSSALSEDSAQASFAGEFETVLDVKTDAEIRAAIASVRASRHTDRVQVYSQAQGLEPGQHELAVVVQRLIRADFAGVLFSVDPLTGDQMHMSGNFVPGLGEKLVSGQVNPQAFTLARPQGRYSGPPELKRAAPELYRCAMRLEKELGGPQDIEWALANGKVYLLQARPITTLSGYKADSAEWNDSLTGNYLWSGTNLVENAPHVLTPFSCSLRKGLVYEGVDFSDGSSVGLAGYPMAGIIGGRGYVNLSVQISTSRPFFGGDTRKAAQQALAWWGSVPADLDIPLVPVSTWTWWTRVLPALTRMIMKIGALRKRIPQFVAENPRWCAEMQQRIWRLSDPAELAALMRDEIAPYSLFAFWITIAAASDLPNRLELELQKEVGAEDANALLSNLSGLSAPLESLGPLLGLAKVARGEMSRADYLQAYGHRGVDENEYAWARPLEDPAWLERQLAQFAKAPLDVETLFARQRAAFDAAWGRYCARYPAKAQATRRRLEQAAQAANQREAVRSEATRSATVMRAFALRAGELAGIGTDVFFLTMPEVQALLAGDRSACRLIPLRKETHARYAALPPYPTLIVGRFDPFQWAADPNRRSDIYNANAPVGVDLRVDPLRADPGRTHRCAPTNTITGFAGALGVVEGTVRRLERLEDGDQLQPGEILVTTLTNIGWTPLFPRLAAIVTDLGAPLSHAAIVARELGIPAVVGCGDATMRLKTGDRVRVNGGKGFVEIL